MVIKKGFTVLLRKYIMIAANRPYQKFSTYKDLNKLEVINKIKA